MSYMLMVFCRRPIEAITRQEIAQAIVEAVFFADTPLAKEKVLQFRELCDTKSSEE